MVGTTTFFARSASAVLAIAELAMQIEEEMEQRGSPKCGGPVGGGGQSASVTALMHAELVDQIRAYTPIVVIARVGASA